jgi:transcriptional regulator with GAF, ATPase, and Fis domain
VFRIGDVVDRKRLDRDCHDGTIQSTITELISALVHGAGIEEMATKLTSASVALVSGAEFAKISLIKNGHLHSIASTSEMAAALLDGAQQAAGQGPCLDAVNAQKPIRCSDLGADVRWPRFAVAATNAGVRAVLSFPMDVPGAARGTLSLFGSEPGALGIGSDGTAAMLAHHAAIALFTAEHERQFKATLATRDVIGQAKGVIMERFGVDSARAFAMLKTISRQTNTPVRQLAASLVNRAGTRDDDARESVRHNYERTGCEYRSRSEGQCSR